MIIIELNNIATQTFIYWNSSQVIVENVPVGLYSILLYCANMIVLNKNVCQFLFSLAHWQVAI